MLVLSLHESLKNTLDDIKWFLEFEIGIEDVFSISPESFKLFLHNLLELGLKISCGNCEYSPTGIANGTVIASFEVPNFYSNLFFALRARKIEELVIQVRHAILTSQYK